MSEKSTAKKFAPEVATVLPPRARLALVKAVSIEPGKGCTESQERTNALDHTIRNIKEQHPEHFKEKK